MSGIWLPEGFAIAGHDSGLAIDAKEFFKSRLFAWDPHQNFGADNSQHFGSITIHFLDYIFSVVAGVPYAGNRVSLFFWLSLLFVSGFIFAYSLKDRLGRLLPILLPVFITFNFYIFQSVFILERAKFGLFAALLLLLTISFKILDKKLSPIFGAFLVSVIFFLFNGGSWLGLPLYGGIGVTMLLFILYAVVTGYQKNNFSGLRRVLLFLVSSLFGYLIINSYSIIPYINTFLQGDLALLSDTGVLAGNKGWLDYISQRTSLINLLRLQGIPDWYSTNNEASLLHPYAVEYINSSILVLFSFMITFLSFLGFSLTSDHKQRNLLGFFGVLTLMGFFFAAGTHPPLGFIYSALFENVSIFSIFRSPYYKFGIVFTLGMSVLLAFTINILIEKLVDYLSGVSGKLKKPFILKTFSLALALVTILLWLFYHYVLFQADAIFHWRDNLATKVKIPEYVNEFANKDLNPNQSRVLLVPELNDDWRNDAYQWGYWSLSTLPSVLTSMPVVTNDSGLTTEERLWVNKLYQSLENSDWETFLSIAQRLNVGKILFRRDVLSDTSWSATKSPSKYEGIQNSPNLKKIGNFGQWDLFNIESIKDAKFLNVNQLISFGDKDIAYLILNSGQHSILTKDSKWADGLISQDIQNYECQSCILDINEPYLSLSPVQVLPNSLLYFLKERNEGIVLAQAKDTNERVEAYYGFILRRTSEVQSMITLQVEESYVNSTLQEIQMQFQEASNLIKTIPDYSTDFYRAKRALQLVNTIERGLSKYIDSEEARQVPTSIKQEILNTIWDARLLKELYRPVLADRTIWDTEKIFRINLTPGQESDFFIDKSTLPKNLTGEEILPQSVVLESGVSKVELQKDAVPAILGPKFKIPPQSSSSAIIKMTFNDLANLYLSGQTKFENVILGQRNCLTGKITNFSPQKIYRTKIDSPYKDQRLSLVVDDGVFNNESDHGFFYGREEKSIQPSKPSKPFRDYYFPRAESKDPTLSICSADDQPPKVDNIIINEVFSPVIFFNRDLAHTALGNPTIEYQQIDPAKYIITIGSSSSPAILLFNERYSPLWRLASGKEIKHFVIDDYANAWVIDPSDSETSYTLEYTPRRFFYIGIAVSALGFIVATAFFIWRLTRYVRSQRTDNGS